MIKIRFLLFISLILCPVFYMTGQEYSLGFDTIASIKGSRGSRKPVDQGGSFWWWFTNSSGYGLMSIDQQTGEILKYDLDGFPYSRDTGSILVSVNHHEKYGKQVVRFDPGENSITPLDAGSKLYSAFNNWSQTVVYYQNDRFLFGRLADAFEDMMSEDLYSADLSTGDLRMIMENTAPLAVSPDGLHVLLYQKGVYSTETFEKKDITLQNLNWGDLFYKYNDIGQIAFLTNNLIIGNAIESMEIKNIYRLDNGEKISFRFSLNNSGKRITAIFFNEDLTRALACYLNRGQEAYALVDTTPFRDWLENNNLLFTPTTGVLKRNIELE